ncbi:PilZ domain-containing protein [Sphingomonas sp. 4RDLI-65]|uniref:PilZ domain-containing protein n=1 Tax=Sphingomonas sp. 4RDLI-65 TaxID=3111641 RepID=UPI003C171AA7
MDSPVPLSRATRTSVMLSTELFRAGRAASSPHRVTNISETGICIAQPGDLIVGSVVVVTIGRIEQVVAEVVWVRSGLAGLRFQAPIDVAEARARRPAGYRSIAPSAGWLAALNDPYAK